jgi:hypothetical protein
MFSFNNRYSVNIFYGIILDTGAAEIFIPYTVKALPQFVACARTPEHQKYRRFGWFAYHSAYINGA